MLRHESAGSAADRSHPVLRQVSSGAAGSWGRAIAVPGLAALNKGREAVVLSVSCSSAGNCGAGGYYHDGGRRGFVDSETNGRWRQAVEVPGLAALSKGGPGQVVEVSCASAGSCAAGGFYRYGGGHHQGFVVNTSNGGWRQAIQVPGLAALNKGGDAEVISVSCAARGSCAAVGFYTDGSGHQHGFVATEQSGVWGKAIEVPGLAALQKGPYARLQSVSCSSAGSCSAGGFYAANASGSTQAFAVSERNGSWGTAKEVAANLNTGRDAEVTSVSCASAGNCAAGGQYSKASGHDQAFVISEANGTWAAARAVAGTLSCCGFAQVTSVSCASAGNCAAGGQYDFGGYNAAFLVNEKNGDWGKPMSVPGLNAVSRDEHLSSVSCASAGNCAAGGNDDVGTWLAREKNGVWGKETTVPGTLPIQAVQSVSCASARNCVAGGSYVAPGPGYALQGFVTR